MERWNDGTMERWNDGTGPEPSEPAPTTSTEMIEAVQLQLSLAETEANSAS